MCVFCSIVKGDIPCNKVEESDDFLAFHDLNPKAPVHILVIPKEHVESFHTASAEVSAGITPFIQKVAAKFGVDKTGYRVISNIGRDGGQEVKHMHIHILGGARLPFGHVSDADSKNKF